MGLAPSQCYGATVEYGGTEYSGFQIQLDRSTIQGELEESLARATGQAVRVHGAGRTDAGVHAAGQVISFRATWAHGSESLQRALNAYLPRDIVVTELGSVPEGFHARFSARRRTYLYTILLREVRSPLARRFAHCVTGNLDVAGMQLAADCLRGERDFAAFGQSPGGTNTVRTVYRAGWQCEAGGWSGFMFEHAPTILRFEIEANAFLRGMVRRIVGSLLLVGSGRWTVPDFSDVIESRDIGRAAAPVPACGLCLWRVVYEHGTWAMEQSGVEHGPSAARSDVGQ